MSKKQESEEYSKLIMQAYKIICKAITDNIDPIVCRYIIAYNKKLDVIEILQKININGKSILQNIPVWPKIETNSPHQILR